MKEEYSGDSERIWVMLWPETVERTARRDRVNVVRRERARDEEAIEVFDG